MRDARLPATLFDALVLGGLLATVLWAQAADAPFTITLATRATILALAAVGLNLALGYAGLVSFGHAAFFGLGGYAAAILASHAQDARPLYDGALTISGTGAMPILWLAALAVGGIAALAIGALSLRTSGAYFIMITLAFAQMLYVASVAWRRYGGEDGLLLYGRGTFPGLDTFDPLTFFALCFAWLLAALALTRAVDAAPLGLALAAIRQAPARAEAVGLTPYRVRLAVFVVSGMVTALAGALFVDLNRFASPVMLHWTTSGEIMVIVILGGVARLTGPVVGACAFVALEHGLADVSDHWLLWLGLLLLAVVLFSRAGLAGLLARPARR